jgi:hypothetical protein
MERRCVSLFREVKHRCISELLHFLPYAAQHCVDIEGPLGWLETRAHRNLRVQRTVQKFEWEQT